MSSPTSVPAFMETASRDMGVIKFEERSAKIVILGQKNVGKTALITKCITKRFLPEYVSGYDSNRPYRTEIDDKNVALELVDSNRKDGLQISLADGYIIVYSITSRSSWLKIKEIIKTIRNNPNTGNKPIGIVGNKTDLDHLREVSKEDAIKLCKRLKVSLFYELSTANDNGSLSRVFKELYKKIEKRRTLAIVYQHPHFNSFNIALLATRFFTKLHARVREKAMNTIVSINKPKSMRKELSIEL